MKTSFFQWVGFIPLLLMGAGCFSIPTSTLSPDEAAETLLLSAGDTLSIQQTVFGLSGSFVGIFGQPEVPQVISVQEWTPDAAQFEWKRTQQIETEASKAAREAYEAKAKNAPVGTELPLKPLPKYETTTEQGTLVTQAMAQSERVLLPLFWPVDQQVGDDTSLIWLSQKQYDELVETRHTKINLGLFDDSISYAMGLTDQVKYLVERIKGSEQAPEQSSVLDVEAQIDWGTFVLKVDGKLTTVRTIRAQNAFANYTILANRENPLILEVLLSPASRGSFDLFNREAIGESFWGYEVSEITHASAPTNADPLQP